jgi:hypothetical protein
MEKTIGQLFEIEAKANHIINRATQEKARLQDDFEKDISKMEEAIVSENTKAINTLKEQADVDLKNELKILILNTEKHLHDLEEMNIKKHEQLVNQVFEILISS